jgi:hypothetical protein
MARAQRQRSMLLRCLFAAAGIILAAGIASGLYATLIAWRWEPHRSLA